MARIIIVEDDQFLQESLKEALEIKSYEIVLCSNVKETREKIHPGIDLIIMDINLPDGDGISLCREIRKQYHIPILFLTCKNEEETIVEALNAGGDDYVSKPFGIQELYARINSILRRIPTNNNKLVSADLMIDKDRYAIYKNNELLELSQVTYLSLVTLIEAHGMVITRDYLLEMIERQTGHFVEDNTLSVHIKRLRQKLGTYQGESYIDTLRGVGYRWKM